MRGGAMSDPAMFVAPREDNPDFQQAQKPASKPVDATLQKALDEALYAGGSQEAQRLRNFLNGTWLGEPLHVVLTDVPIGAWAAAMIFDAVSLVGWGRKARGADDAS